jgi:hypothetical protein
MAEDSPPFLPLRALAAARKTELPSNGASTLQKVCAHEEEVRGRKRRRRRGRKSAKTPQREREKERE